MVSFSRWKHTFIAMLAALGGCAGMSEGPVPVSSSPDPRLAQLQQAMQDECLALIPPESDVETLRLRRNHLVSAYMTAADLAYNDYERALLGHQRSTELGASVASQIVSAIGGLAGDQNLAQAASVAGGVVSGTRDAMVRSLLNQTVSVLQTHMRASRAAQYTIIVERRGLPYADWDSCMALSDALAYEQAGTLNAALAAMAASAAEEEESNDEDARQAVERITYNRDDLSVALRTYLRRGDAQRSTARAALEELIAEGSIPRPAYSVAQYLGEFHAGRGSPAERSALARRIVQKENGSEAGVALAEALGQ